MPWISSGFAWKARLSCVTQLNWRFQEDPKSKWITRRLVYTTL
jgi:hypothetical protein